MKPFSLTKKVAFLSCASPLSAITSPLAESLESFTDKVLSTLLWEVGLARSLPLASDQRSHFDPVNINDHLLLLSPSTRPWRSTLPCSGAVFVILAGLVSSRLELLYINRPIQGEEVAQWQHGSLFNVVLSLSNYCENGKHQAQWIIINATNKVIF